jgi:hypothetical protein
VTVAVCYLSAEGVVLGADSTSTWNIPGSPHYFNHGQKLFEIGEDSTLGIVTWGLGGLNAGSHRALTATLADDLNGNPPASVQQVAERWAAQFWTAYTGSMGAEIQRCQDLNAKPAFGTPNPTATPRTEQEEHEFNALRAYLPVGFCIGGYLPATREPEAFEVLFDPLGNLPTPNPLPRHDACVWGVPNIVMRLILGSDPRLADDILNSGHWNGTPTELLSILNSHAFLHPPLPMRDAIDYVHMCIFSTIKALKFSPYSQTCGGPVEIAVITADRKFRWVKHKQWDSAINGGE